MESLYAVPVLDRWLVHAPLSELSALVNRAALKCLERGGLAAETGMLAELTAALREAPPEAPGPRRGPLRPQFLGIIPTRACNLRCAYCGFGAGRAPQQRMEYALAAAAVDWMAEHAAGLGEDRLEVHFFGGEPFVAADVVEVVVHRTRAVAARQGLTPRLEVATNGVFDEDRARFVGDYFDTVVLSFDGPEEVHDRHRAGPDGGGSYQAVARTAERLSQSPTELCFRVCVSDRNVGRLPEIAAWFCERFDPSVIDFEVLQPTPESDAAGLGRPDPYRFAVGCVEACRVVRERGVRPVYAAAMPSAPRVTFCPVGNDAIILSPDGRASACYLLQEEWQRRGMDLDLGRLEGGGRLNLDAEAVARVRRLVADKPRCRRCFCRWTCAGGCHVNNTYPGCPEQYNDFCIQTRIISACALLDELGCRTTTDTLLGDRSALEALALRPDDTLAGGG